MGVSKNHCIILILASVLLSSICQEQEDPAPVVDRSVPKSVGSTQRKENCEGGNCPQNGEPRRDYQASNIAIKAAQEAKEAQEAQQMAGAQAAHVVKAQLADKAGQAAHAAQAALEGKEAMVEQLHKELREAIAVVEEEANSYHETQGNLQASLAALAQASQVLKTLTYSIQVAQNNVANSQQAAEGAQSELAEKTALVDAARGRVEALKKEMDMAKQDLGAIRQAAIKAESAAKSAENAAQRARRTEGPKSLNARKRRHRTFQMKRRSSHPHSAHALNPSDS